MTPPWMWPSQKVISQPTELNYMDHFYHSFLSHLHWFVKRLYFYYTFGICKIIHSSHLEKNFGQKKKKKKKSLLCRQNRLPIPPTPSHYLHFSSAHGRAAPQTSSWWTWAPAAHSLPVPSSDSTQPRRDICSVMRDLPHNSRASW